MSEMEAEGISLPFPLLIRQCVYETLNDPCKLCQQRGFQCGREEKVLGPKRRLKVLDGDINQSIGELTLEILRLPRRIFRDELTPFDRHCLSTLSNSPFLSPYPSP